MPLPLDTAVHAAREAAALIRREAGRADVRYKGPQDLVTATDEAAQHLIGAILVEAFPDSFVVGEEGPTQDAPPGTRMRWIVDPIDGTINFAHGAPAYAVSIGLEVDGAMEVGVILDVSRDELFAAQRGQGATLNGSPIAVSKTPTLAEALVAHGMPYRCHAYRAAYVSVLEAMLEAVQGQRRLGSAALDLAYVASGRFDAGFLVGIRPWDVAAGWLLIEEAGGRVTDFRGDSYRLGRPQIAFSNALTHNSLQDLVYPLREVDC